MDVTSAKLMMLGWNIVYVNYEELWSKSIPNSKIMCVLCFCERIITDYYTEGSIGQFQLYFLT